MAATQEEVTFSVLIEENRQLSKDLKVTEKLLETYRKCLLMFNTNCSCPQNSDNKIKLESLEIFYDQHINSKAIKDQNQLETGDKSTLIFDRTEQLFSETLDIKDSEVKKRRVSSDYSEDDNEGSAADEDLDISSEITTENPSPRLSTSNGEHKKFVCEYKGCSRSFEDNYHLKRHVMGCHTFEKPFECQNCDKSFSRSDHLVKHVRNNHKNYKKYVCSHENCDFITIFEDKYKLHESRHQIVCKECGKTFDTKYELKVHKTKDHKTVVPKTKKQVSKSLKKSLKRGPKTSKMCVKREATDEDYYETQSPEDSCGEPSKFSPKKKKVLSGADLKSKLKIFEVHKEIVCPEVGCGKQFKCVQNLRKHTKTVHLNLRPFPCDWPGCESAFKTREAMTNHKSVHSNERNFKCDVEGCNKSFKIRCKLTQHMRCHGVGPKNERFPCSWPACGQFCASEQALTEHLNRHQNIRPFVCQFDGCGKSYFTSFELRQHSMKFHEQNESFRCDYKDCTMSFLNKRDLAKHRRLHIDVARFVCSWPECCHTFNTSRDLSDHMNRHMDIKANKCHFLGCDRSYFTKKDLMRHIKQSHS